MFTDPDGVPSVDVYESLDLLGSGAVLLDVRESDEWMAGHAPVARFMPMDSVPELVTTLAGDVPIVVICRSGRRSALVARYLNDRGFTSCNLVGGMQAWQQCGQAVVRDDGSVGSVI